MSSGMFSNGVINYTGSLPGIYQGLAAAMPATSFATGDWYLQTDVKKLFRWTGSAWVEQLSDGGAGTAPDLNTVMSTAPGFGTSNQQLSIQNVIRVINGVGAQSVGLKSETLDANGSSVNVESPTIVAFPDRPGAALQAGKTTGKGASMILYYRSGADAAFFICKDIIGTGRQSQFNFRSIGTATFDVAYLQDLVHINRTFAGVNTLTSYNIAHGLSFTPTFATIVAKNASSATLLAGGYSLAYTATNIVLNLLVATVGTPALNFDLFILQ